LLTGGESAVYVKSFSFRNIGYNAAEKERIENGYGDRHALLMFIVQKNIYIFDKNLTEEEGKSSIHKAISFPTRCIELIRKFSK
jgi:hypothetical protein